MFLIVVRKGNVSINLCVYLYYLCDYSLQAPLYVKLYIYMHLFPPCLSKLFVSVLK